MMLALAALLAGLDAFAFRTLEGATVEPFSGSHAISAFVFVHPDCPVSSRYAPELNRLHAEFSARGVALYLVYPGRDDAEHVIKEHYAAFDLRAPALRDPQYRLADLAGATMTPEAAVFAAGRRLIYRGRIDDRAVRLGVWRAAASQRDLATVLDRLARGDAVAPFTTQAVGCYIRP